MDDIISALKYIGVDAKAFEYANFDNFETEFVKSEIINEGYCVVRNLISSKILELMRNFWLDLYHDPAIDGPVTWSPYYGQENQIGRSVNDFGHVYRSVEFLWNNPYDHMTREISLIINCLRNKLIDEPLLSGVVPSPNGYFIFATTSYYPHGKGWMKFHSDGLAGGKPLVHFILPITHKSLNYANGGLHLVKASGEKVDVDGLLTPGDVVFYDARISHGVELISGEGTRETCGRIQMFAIPSIFMRQGMNLEALGRTPNMLLARSRYVLAKNKIYKLLGKEPILRS